MNLDQFKRDNKFLMLAFDHRGSFKKLMNPQDPDVVTMDEEIALKKEIIDSLRDEFSSVLIDQEIGYKAYEPKDKPFLLPIEKTGYELSGKDRITELEYSVEDLKKMGASGVKILLWFNYHLLSSEKQIEVVRQVLEDCKNNEMPFFLETRSYDPEKGEGEDLSSDDMNDLVLGGLKLLLQKGIEPDVYKLEYPGSALGCQTITAILQEHNSGKNIPWILLTMGASFEAFIKELEEASIRGCQGFLAGRAVWQEVCSMKGEEKAKFLKITLPERFRKISEIVTRN